MERIAQAGNKISHEEWLALRKKGIGGSDAGAICGMNPYMSPMAVYLDKTSDEIVENDNEAMRQGRDLEDYVARRFMEETGKKVRRTNYILGNNKFPFMLANVDRLICGEKAGLECKTVSAFGAAQWKELQIPAHYAMQCYHYMAVTGADAWYLAVVILGSAFKYVKIERDEGVINNLISIEKKFWEENVMAHVPPDPDGTDATDDVFRRCYFRAETGKSIHLDDVTEQLKRHEILTGFIDKMTTEKKQIEQTLKVKMDDAETAYAGDYVINWKEIHSSRLDSNSLKVDKPEIYDQYCRDVESRRFSIRKAG